MPKRSGSPIPARGRFLAIRAFLILSTALLILPPGLRGTLPVFGTTMVGLFLLSVLGLLFVPEDLLWKRRTQYSLTLFDTFLIALGLFYFQPGRPELALAFFLVLFLSTIGRDLLRIASGTALVAGFFLFLSQRGGTGLPLTEALLQVPFLFMSGVYYGFTVVRVQEEQEQAVRLEEERGYLKNLLEITTTTNSRLDLQEVLSAIVTNVAGMVDAVRCSIVFTREEGKRFVVMASSDSIDFQPLDLEPEKYPELRECLRTRRPVVIGDVSKEPIMADCRVVLQQTDFRSILVLPLLFRNEFLGMLFIRSSRQERAFSPRDIRTCQIVANASANALKNALLFDRTREEVRIRKETSDLLRNILDHSPDMIFLVDTAGLLKDLNPAGERFLGLKRDAVIGRPAARLFFGSEIPLTPESLKKANGSLTNHQVLLRHANGALRHGIVSISLLHDGKNNPNGIVGICKDLTDLRQAQKELRDAQKSSAIQSVLERVKAISDPLSGVVGYAQLLLEECPDARTERGMQRILNASLKCRRVLDNLLHFSRQQTLELEEKSLPRILREVLESRREDLQKKRISVRCELQDDLPPLELDAGKMKQVFLHLMENSEQAIASTGEAGTITIRGGMKGGHLSFSIEDNGPGIPYQNARKIFEPFFTTRGEEKGSGIGLWAAHCIIRAHGGRIYSEPRTSGGAKFVIDLPIGSTNRPIGPAVRPAADPPTPLRILAVDDEQVVLDLLVDVLKLQGHSVDTARSGNEALEKIGKYPYDAILLDLRLPDQHGTEVFRKIRNRWPRLAKKIIFNSVDTYQPGTRKFIRESGNRSIQKPFRLEDLDLALTSLSGTAS